MEQTKFRQTAYIYLIGVCCFSAFLLPGAVSGFADKTAVFVPLLGSGISVIYARFLYRLLRRHGSLRRMVACRRGERGVKIADFTIALWLFGIAVFYINAFYDRLASTAFGYMPRWVVVCAAVLSAALFASAAPKTVARSGSIIFFILLATLVLLFAFSAKGVDIQSLLPVKYKNFTFFVRALLFPVGVSGLLSFFAYHFEAPPLRFRALVGCQMAAGGFMSAIILFTQGVFGTAFAGKLSYPFFALIKSTDALIRLEHFESLISGIWIVMSLGFFIALLSVIITIWRRRLCKCTPAVKDVFTLLPHALLLLCALLLPENRFFNEFVLGTLMPIGNIALGIVPVCILSLTNKE
ncbi:MAG: GerAB/ArcD/ProY family transporter [Clostridia bacterium]|nr:GerAB/ArcD/ProY family transporter [Clostridia bacterium]